MGKWRSVGGWRSSGGWVAVAAAEVLFDVECGAGQEGAADGQMGGADRG